MKSIFSNLPNNLIMRIIKESTVLTNIDYHQRRTPNNFVNIYAKALIVLKNKSELVKSFTEYTDPTIHILLPRFMRGADYPDYPDYPDDGIPKTWCKPFSSTLLTHTMGNEYWEVRQKQLQLN